MTNHELLDMWRATLDRHFEPLDYVAVLFGAGVARTVQERCARVCDEWHEDGKHVAHQLAQQIRELATSKGEFNE